MPPFVSLHTLAAADTVSESAGLRLAPTNKTDAEDIFRTFTAEVTRYMFSKPAERLEDALRFIEESRNGGRGEPPAHHLAESHR